MIAGLSKENWEAIRPRKNPFLRYEFFEALVKSGSVGPEAGWIPVVFLNTTQDAALYTFVKSHSYGEYIFDWSWAEAFNKYGMPYYPKLTSMLPFTPVTTTPFLMNKFDPEKAGSLLQSYEALYLKEDISSSHFLFLTAEEIPFFASHGYMIRESIQYHFFNENYTDMEQFYSQLKGRKAKQIRQERQHPGLEIKTYTKEALTSQHAETMYEFYISTIENKNSQDYLNQEFFKIIFQTMPENILYVEATKEGIPVAGSLFFYDEERLYGRYWGAAGFYQKLHFELCYYQGIDFCLKQNIKIFEAGAQGEHKISRGFRPVRIYSAHKIKHPAFSEAIANFIRGEKQQIDLAITQLSKSLPFKDEFMRNIV